MGGASVIVFSDLLVGGCGRYDMLVVSYNRFIRPYFLLAGVGRLRDALPIIKVRPKAVLVPGLNWSRRMRSVRAVLAFGRDMGVNQSETKVRPKKGVFKNVG